MAKYDKKSQGKVKKVMDEFKSGELKSGNSDKPVKSRKQAIAIGLSEARKEGAKVPAKKSSKKTTARKAAPKAKSQRGAAKRKTTTASRKKATSKK